MSVIMCRVLGLEHQVWVINSQADVINILKNETLLFLGSMQVLTDAVSVSSVEKVFNCSQINQNRLSGLCYSLFSFFIDLCNWNTHMFASLRIYENTVKIIYVH